MREDGYLNIVGRLKDMIIRGGENIYPRGDRRVSAHPPQDQRSASDRCARQEYGEKFAHGSGCAKDRNDSREIVTTAAPDRNVQDPPLHPFHHRVPMTVTGRSRNSESEKRCERARNQCRANRLKEIYNRCE